MLVQKGISLFALEQVHDAPGIMYTHIYIYVKEKVNDKRIANTDFCAHHRHHNKPDVDPCRGTRGQKKLWW